MELGWAIFLYKETSLIKVDTTERYSGGHGIVHILATEVQRTWQFIRLG